MSFDILTIVNETLKTGKRFFIKNKPRIFMVGGIGLSAAGTVTACAATYKHFDRIMDNAAGGMEVANDSDNPGKEKLKVIGETAVELAKTYAIPTALCAAGYGSIVYANHVQEQRQAVLSESLTTLGAAYAAYRKRVEEKLGKEEEEKIRLGVTETEITHDNAGEITKETVEMVDKDDAATTSPFAKFFDAASRCYVGEPEYDLTFLRLMEKECNQQLQMDGYLLLSDVYKKLDIPITKASLVAGWVYDSNDDISDHYVDFGLYDRTRPGVRRFVNGYEDVILLDFNCAANIADHI